MNHHKGSVVFCFHFDFWWFLWFCVKALLDLDFALWAHGLSFLLGREKRLPCNETSLRILFDENAWKPPISGQKEHVFTDRKNALVSDGYLLFRLSYRECPAISQQHLFRLYCHIFVLYFYFLITYNMCTTCRYCEQSYNIGARQCLSVCLAKDDDFRLGMPEQDGFFPFLQVRSQNSGCSFSLVL